MTTTGSVVGWVLLKSAGLGVIVLLAGCGGGETQRLDAALQQQQRAHLALIEALTARLDAIEAQPELHFVISEFDMAIEEKMFQPMLKASALLTAQAEDIPDTFYVDVLLQIDVNSEQFQSVTRQVFPVIEGRSKIELRNRLPVHGLNQDQINVTLRPMNWYGSQKISSQQITFQ